VVSNALASQRVDGSQVVDISYQLTGAIAATTVSLQISTDDGVTWPITPAAVNVSGDVDWVTTDGAKTIAYNANEDLPRTSTSLARAKVIAVDDVLTIMLPGDVPMELVRIPAGTFTMGSPVTELSRGTDENQFEVQLTSSFYMGRTEVTQKQWLAVRGSWPSLAPSSGLGLGDNYPAYYVSWNDIQNFMTSLNAHIESTGQGPAVVRLPTEAEWEYCCRGGTTTRFSFGNGLGAQEDCSAEAERVNNMWYCGNNGDFNAPTYGSKSVGQKFANSFGLHDMHGNVWEWCQDLYGTYPTSPPTQVNPTGASTGSTRVLRGGYWSIGARHCRSARRYGVAPTARTSEFGFRVLADR
jgi:formylglycine-generating enzyme required for sulfatase activity